MRAPAVSIILPTYNRAKFLPEAIGAIRGQQFTDWELIVVDDGSTDETAELLPRLIEGMQQPYRYILQENQGAYAARNTGLDHVRGRYVAFYDSDDLWLPHHLAKCASALDEYSDIGWVYSASRIVNHSTGEILNENCFQERGQLRRFRTLPVERRAELHVLQHEGLLTEVLNDAGLYSGLQNSVINSSFFAERRFVTEFYNEAEDQVVVLRAIAAGIRFAYFDDVHVEYRVHDSNSSGASVGGSVQKKTRIALGAIRGFQELPRQIQLTRAGERSLRRRLAQLHFWNLGYSVLWANKEYRAALKSFRSGYVLSPFDLAMMKTLCAAHLRVLAVTAYRLILGRDAGVKNINA